MRIGVGPGVGTLRAERFMEAVVRADPSVEFEVVAEGSLGGGPEAALADGAVDCLVRPLEEVPAVLGGGLTIGACTARGDPRFAASPRPLEDVPEGSSVCVGTALLECELAGCRPDLRAVRGPAGASVGTADALGLAGEPFHPLDPDVFVPAPGQGVTAALCRADDGLVRGMLSKADSSATRLEVGVERGIVRMMQAGPDAPVGVHARAAGGSVHVDAVSFGYAGGPRRVSADLPPDYVMDELLDVAEALLGRRRRAGAPPEPSKVSFPVSSTLRGGVSPHDRTCSVVCGGSPDMFDECANTVVYKQTTRLTLDLYIFIPTGRI